MRRFRFRGLARRYGHAGMSGVHSTMGDIRKLASDNAPITAAVLGGAMGAIASEMGVGTAAMLGAVTGVAAQQLTKK